MFHDVRNLVSTIVLVIIAVALIVVAMPGCATVPAAPPNCKTLVQELDKKNIGDGYVLSGNEQGPAGEVVLGYARDTDSTMRIEILVPKTYPAPPADMKIETGSDCMAPNGVLYKTFHREIAIPGKKA